VTHRDALAVLAAHRGDRVVLTTMGSVGIWPALSDTPLDFAYIPSSMGQGVAVGLGWRWRRAGAWSRSRGTGRS
jgi:hypothetical protein